MKIVSILLVSQLASAQLMGAPHRHLRRGRINLNRENASDSATTTDYFRHLVEDASSMSMSTAQAFSGEIKKPNTQESSKGSSMSYPAKAASTKGSSMSYSTKAPKSESIPTIKSVKGSMSYSSKATSAPKSESVPTIKSVKGSMSYSTKAPKSESIPTIWRSYKAGIITAITDLKDRTISLQAIKIHMMAALPADKKWANGIFLNTINKMVADGDLTRVMGTYELSADFKKKAAAASKSVKGSMSYSSKATSAPKSESIPTIKSVKGSMSYSSKATSAPKSESIPTIKSVKGSMSYSTKATSAPKSESIPTIKSVKGSMSYSSKALLRRQSLNPFLPSRV